MSGWKEQIEEKDDSPLRTKHTDIQIRGLNLGFNLGFGILGGIHRSCLLTQHQAMSTSRQQQRLLDEFGTRWRCRSQLGLPRKIRESQRHSSQVNATSATIYLIQTSRGCRCSTNLHGTGSSTSIRSCSCRLVNEGLARFRSLAFESLGFLRSASCIEIGRCKLGRAALGLQQLCLPFIVEKLECHQIDRLQHRSRTNESAQFGPIRTSWSDSVRFGQPQQTLFLFQ